MNKILIKILVILLLTLSASVSSAQVSVSVITDNNTVLIGKSTNLFKNNQTRLLEAVGSRFVAMTNGNAYNLTMRRIGSATSALINSNGNFTWVNANGTFAAIGPAGFDAGSLNLNTTGTNTAAYFVGDGSRLTGLVNNSIIQWGTIVTNQIVTTNYGITVSGAGNSAANGNYFSTGGSSILYTNGSGNIQYANLIGQYYYYIVQGTYLYANTDLTGNYYIGFGASGAQFPPLVYSNSIYTTNFVLKTNFVGIFNGDGNNLKVAGSNVSGLGTGAFANIASYVLTNDPRVVLALTNAAAFDAAIQLGDSQRVSTNGGVVGFLSSSSGDTQPIARDTSVVIIEGDAGGYNGRYPWNGTDYHYENTAIDTRIYAGTYQYQGYVIATNADGTENVITSGNSATYNYKQDAGSFTVSYGTKSVAQNFEGNGKGITNIQPSSIVGGFVSTNVWTLTNAILRAGIDGKVDKMNGVLTTPIIRVGDVGGWKLNIIASGEQSLFFENIYNQGEGVTFDSDGGVHAGSFGNGFYGKGGYLTDIQYSALANGGTIITNINKNTNYIGYFNATNHTLYIGTNPVASASDFASTNYVNTATNNVTTNLLAVIYNASNAVWSAQNTLSNYNRLALTWTTNKFTAQDATNALKLNALNGTATGFVAQNSGDLRPNILITNTEGMQWGVVLDYQGDGLLHFTNYITGKEITFDSESVIYADQFSGNGYNLTNLQASAIVGGFDSLTVTNTLYLGGDGQQNPEIRIPNSGNLYFKTPSGSGTLFTLDQYGDGDFTGDIHGYNIYAQNNLNAGYNLHVNNTIDLGSGNTTLTAAQPGSLSVGSGTASGAYSFAASDSTASGVYSFASGHGIATGNYSAAFNNSTASGLGSFASGGTAVASGYLSFASGNSSLASGVSSFASGYDTVASGSYSFAGGEGGLASGSSSFASGYYTTASGDNSHAEGVNTVAQGRGSHAAGWKSFASHDNTYVWSSDEFNVFQSSTTNQFSVFASGGIRLLGGAISGDGSQLTSVHATTVADISTNTVDYSQLANGGTIITNIVKNTNYLGYFNATNHTLCIGTNPVASAFGSVDASNLVSGTIALARYGFTPATNGAAIVYSQLPYQGLITNANGVNITNVVASALITSPTLTNIMVWGDSNRTNAFTFSPNGLVITNSVGGITNKGGSVTGSGTATFANFAGNGSGLTSITAATATLASYVSGSLTNPVPSTNITTPAGAGTVLTSDGTNVTTSSRFIAIGVNPVSAYFQQATTTTPTTNKMSISIGSAQWSVQSSTLTGAVTLATSGLLTVSNLSATGTLTAGASTLGAITTSGSLLQSSGNLVPAAGVILNYFNQDCTLTRASAGTVLVTTNLTAPGTITAYNGFAVTTTNSTALNPTGYTNTLSVNQDVQITASTTAVWYLTNGVQYINIGLISNAGPPYQYTLHANERIIGTGITGFARP